MSLKSYRLSYATMINLMRMIDLGQISVISLPKRQELSEVHRFIKDYIEYKRSM